MMTIEGELWTDAVEYFGSEEKALAWMQTPNIQLNGEKPGDYCTDRYSGDLKVKELIRRMKHSQLS